ETAGRALVRDCAALLGRCRPSRRVRAPGLSHRVQLPRTGSSPRVHHPPASTRADPSAPRGAEVLAVRAGRPLHVGLLGRAALASARGATAGSPGRASCTLARRVTSYGVPSAWKSRASSAAVTVRSPSPAYATSCLLPIGPCCVPP